LNGPTRGVLDTSVFIARESGRPLDESILPDESAISVVTLAELHAGVLAATDTDVRARRLATLNTVADMLVLPIEEEAAIMWGRMRALLAETGRRVNVNDLWIAATAASRHLPVITQDDDFHPLAGLAGLVVIEA
jgi:predicted nucleic acid-binding protein